MPIKFSYLYRDAANHKKSHTVVLDNPDGLTLPEVTNQITPLLSDDEFFIADQIGIPEIFLWETGKSDATDDHCWHEFSGLSETDETDESLCTVNELLEQMQIASLNGWAEFLVEDGHRIVLPRTPQMPIPSLMAVRSLMRRQSRPCRKTIAATYASLRPDRLVIACVIPPSKQSALGTSSNAKRLAPNSKSRSCWKPSKYNARATNSVVSMAFIRIR